MNKAHKLLVFLIALSGSPMSYAQEAASEDWNGVWIAEGTFFSIAVHVSQNRIEVSEVESLGFEWSSRPGTVSGQRAIVEVQYAGATAQILAELVTANSAVARALSCSPEYLVVCTLAKDRQARFIRKGTTPDPSTLTPTPFDATPSKDPLPEDPFPDVFDDF